jgi:aminoglycoside phosphotransferase (APT) family kinase protein
MKPLLPNDPVLPQLAQALDAQAMGAVFARLLREAGGATLRGCTIDRAKYRPRRNCTVSYRLELDDGRGGRIEQLAGARFLSGGESAARLAKARQRLNHPTAAGPALLHDPALDMFAYLAPNDPKIAALPRLMHGSALQLEGHIVTGASIVQYVPEQRATARIVARATDRPQAPDSVFYVKADPLGRGVQTDAVLRALGASPAAREGRLHTPRSIAWQPVEGLHWQQGVPGVALMDHPQRHTPHVAARIGTAMAAMHTTEVPCERPLDASDLHERLREVLDVLWFLDGNTLAQAERLAARLERLIPLIASQPQATLHGDAHPRNFLIDGSDLWMIDLDSVRRGPAVMDVASWMADALFRDTIDDAEGRSRLLNQAFLDSYTRQVPWPVDPLALNAALAHELLCQRAYRCAANLKAGRLAHVPALLDMAENLLTPLCTKAAA